MRLSGTASYIHAAPDAIDSLGKRNGTHGTVGAAPKVAGWLIGWAYRGDVVEIVGTQRKLDWFNGWGYWQATWEQWAAGRQTYPT